MESILFIVFGIILALFLIVDLGYLNRQAHRVSTKSALIQSIFWIAISVVFGGLIWVFVGHELAAQFFSAYVTEKMLSVDNLFVIMMIFAFFQVDPKYHHRVLLWGILGAVVLRGIFILAGTFLVTQFHWLLYFFGAFLVYTGFKLLKSGNEEEQEDFNNKRVVRWVKKYLPLTTQEHNGKFLTRINGKIHFTMLFMVLLLVETTDILFAFDSIPAVFAITQDLFIAFTSNIFAVMGLRALYFLVESILEKFWLIGKGVSFILIFIGGKMFADIFNIHISSLISLMVIIGTLGISVVASIQFPKPVEATE